MPHAGRMFNMTLHHKLQHLRLRSGYRQRSAAKLTGISPQRWNHLETGTRRPSPTELLRIQALLGPLTGFLRPRGVLRSLRNEGTKVLPKSCPFLVVADRTPHTRFLAAEKRYPRAVRKLMTLISARADYAECEHLCHQLALGSCDEAMFVLQMMAAGARPMYVVPGYLPSTPRQMVDPINRSPVSHRPFPCFWLDGGLYFFQVTFATPRLHTVDVLRWQGQWMVIEIDGKGHDSTFDAERSAALQLPTLRFTGQQVSSPTFRLAA